MAKTEQTVAPEVAPVDPWNDLVEYTAPLDNEKDTSDVYAAINGHNFVIKRGEKVMIPKCVKEMLDNAEVQHQEAIKLKLGMKK